MTTFLTVKRNISIVAALVLCALLVCACSPQEAIDYISSINLTKEDVEEIEKVADDVVKTIVVSTQETPVILPAEPEEEEVVEEDIYDPVGKAYSIHAASKEETTLGFVGDVGFAAGYATIRVYRENGEDVNAVMDSEVLSTMRGMDIMMANNEFPYSDRGTPTPDKTYTFRADPKDVHIMNDLGVDIVSLANNHAYDYGPDALIDTVDILNEAKLPFVGAGKNIDEAMRPVYFHVNGHVIAYVSATQIERYGNPDTKEATQDSPGVLRTLDPAKTVSVIEEAEANSDFVIMYVHWGSESTDLVEQSQRDLAKAYVDAGADLVIGDHSHCLQGVDYVDGVPVFYSLGNFWFNSKTLDTCIVKVTLGEDFGISNVSFIPCIQSGSKVRIANPDEKSRIIEYMRGISNYAEFDDDGNVTLSDTDHNTQGGQNTSPARKAPEPSETMPSVEDLLNAALQENTPAQDNPQ